MNWVRSATAPETMVAAVAANITWNTQKVKSENASSTTAPARKNLLEPNSPAASAPNMMPKPIAQNASVPMEKSIRFFIMMLAAFLARVNPVSSMANPACIRNTSTAAINVHTVSIATAFEFESAKPYTAPNTNSAPAVIRKRRTLQVLLDTDLCDVDQ